MIPPPKSCVHYNNALTFDLATRNLQLTARAAIVAQASQVVIPTRSDRTEPIFELALKF